MVRRAAWRPPRDSAQRRNRGLRIADDRLAGPALLGRGARERGSRAYRRDRDAAARSGASRRDTAHARRRGGSRAGRNRGARVAFIVGVGRRGGAGDLIATRLLEAVLPGATPPTPAVAADPEPAETAARGWLSSLASGDAAGLAMEPELRSYLDEGRLNDAREGLTAAGALDGLALLASGERGGMAWHRVQAQFRSRKADVFFRQATSGALSEFNVFPMP